MTKSPLGNDFEGTYEEHIEYIGMRHIENSETPTEWKNRIWNRLMYFRNKKYYTYGEEDCFYAHKALPHLVDGQTYSPKCERYVYNCMEGKFKTEKFRYISFNGAHWGMYQHWATACTGNKFCKLNFEEYMEIKKLILLDQWMSFHQIIQFGKFRRRNPYTVLTCIKDKFGIHADNKLYSYALWLENVSRRIRHIRQKRALLNI
ncbi:13056_t:CDS:2 [Funneliformis geosporum]|uniref:13056_t:CDS:1 n=1 Tax=Funneliformis geosporum TaxID=1117311 RepID=A0A9W4SYW9_9GLOM|nr:13056_t:CDS:2 [Funneliformis geosporum]